MIDRLRSSWELIRKHKVVFAGILITVIPASYLMMSTFSYSDNHIILSQTIWSDFTGHFPLIRSFSHGFNWELASPTFAGELIRYHFGFYFIVAMLELFGVRIDLAINLLSIIGFAGMLLLAYFAAIKYSKKITAGVTAVLLILFNPSLSWYYYLHPDHLNLRSIEQIVTNQNFGSFGPYDNHVISAFWSLNVFLHQRHLGFAFLLMGGVFILLNIKHTRFRKAAAVILILLLSWTNQAVLFIMFVLLGLNIIEHYLHKKNWAQLLFFVSIGVAVSLTAITFISSRSLGAGEAFVVNPGFIYYGTDWSEFPYIQGDLTQWVVYWILNMGILPVLGFLGFLLVAPFHKPKGKNLQKRLQDVFKQLFTLERIPYLSAIVMFVIANIFIFSRDPSTNHKFINYVIIIFAIYAAVFLAKLLTIKRMPAFVVLLLFTTLGGLFDFWPVVNANRHTLPDIQASDTAVWIQANTKRDAGFLNITADFNPVMSTGRRLYFGPQYINWSLGYDTIGRLDHMQSITRGAETPQFICEIAKTYDLGYIITSLHPAEYLETPKDLRFFEDNFTQVFMSNDSYFKIYDLSIDCPTYLQ